VKHQGQKYIRGRSSMRQGNAMGEEKNWKSQRESCLEGPGKFLKTREKGMATLATRSGRLEEKKKKKNKATNQDD